MSAPVSLLLMLVLNLLWVKSQAQGSLPTASIEPTYAILAPGLPVTFTCTITGTTSSVTWRRNNVLVTNDANNVIDSAQNELIVSDFLGNLANYTCVASNDVGTVSSSSAVLQVAVHDANFFSSDVTAPHEVTVQAGQPTAIDCGSFTNIPTTNLDWEVQFGDMFERVNLANERATIGLNQSLYLLEPIAAETPFLFRCILRNTDLGDLANGYVRVTVQGSTSASPGPFILVPPQDVTTRLGETVSFECIPGGMGASGKTAVWTAPNGVTNFRASGDSFRLSISDVNADNVGVYTCTIEGIDSLSANLQLTAPPVLDSALPTEAVSLVYGEALSLTCASSTGTYWEWFQNGVRLSDVTGGSLDVSSATLEHSGAYQCIAYNFAGHAKSSSQVQVMTIAADITQTLPDHQVIFRTQPFSMSCLAQGAPPPTYQWFKGDTPLETGTAFEVGSAGNLLIREVDGSAEGSYRCTATNVLPDGQEVGADSTITLITTIIPTTITTRNIGPLFSVQVETGAILPCQAISNPTSLINYSWTKDGQPLELSGRIQLVSTGSGNLSFTPVEFADEGVYQCAVTTMHEGLQAPTVRSMDITLDVTDTPVAPHILSYNSSSPNSFRIEYIFSGIPTFVSNYTIEVQAPPHDQDNTPWIPLQTRSSNAVTAADVSSGVLEAFTLYKVRVVATYTTGIRVPSDVVMVTTGADTPLDAPRDVAVHAPNNMALSLTWKPPSNPRGHITDYVIQYVMKDDDAVNTISVGGNQTLHVIDGLKEFTRFTVKVAAVTTAGPGPFSEGVEGITIEGGLEEPTSDSFVSTIGFIVLIVALVLVLVVSVVIGILVFKHRCYNNRNKTKGRYHVRHSGIFNKVVIGTEAPDMDMDAPDLSENAVASYTARHKRAFNSTSPSAGSDPLEATLEGESSFGGTEYTVTTGTPQLGSGAHLFGSNAPSYIDPPSFEETLIKARSRSHSSSSAFGNRDLDRPRNDEWDNKQGQVEMGGVFNNPNNAEYMYNDSDNSIEKDPFDTASDMTDQRSDHTQYSHLAGANTNPSAVDPSSVIFHHQLNLPQSAGGSSGGAAPISFSDMVDNRLREQSPDGTSALNYATYV